ncbi:hypothetical protein ACFX15_000628 [Malus domestica]
MKLQPAVRTTRPQPQPHLNPSAAVPRAQLSPRRNCSSTHDQFQSRASSSTFGGLAFPKSSVMNKRWSLCSPKRRRSTRIRKEMDEWIRKERESCVAVRPFGGERRKQQ